MTSTVLLVDDDANLLSGLARAMHRQPFHVYTARDGEEAIRFMKTRNVDVIVADECMPGMSGGDLLAWVAAHCPDVMRMTLSACATVDTAARAVNEAGVCRFFTKPCNEARLAAAIHDAIERKQNVQQERQSAEELRRQLSKLARENDEFKRHLEMVSQDLQRRLDQILDDCRRLEERSGERLDRELRALLDSIRTTAADVRRIVAPAPADAAT